MKKTISTLLLVLGMTTLLVAQRDSSEIKTIFSKNKPNGGFFGLDLGYSEINKSGGITYAIRGGAIIDRWFSIGLVGKGLSTKVSYPFEEVQTENYYLNAGYGGLFIEPIIGSKLPIHLSFPVIIAVGGTSFTNDHLQSNSVVHNNSDAFIIIEPGANLELNLTNYFRIGFGAIYRKAHGLNLHGFGSSLLDGWSGNISLKLGAF